MAPPEMVWIAEVESGFNPRARSPVGAAGMFQLMPDTARSLGLSLRPRDQRLDEKPSAKAAATYLRNLALRFHDWRLAVAAYNAGESRVHDLLQRHRAKSYDAIAENLPAETQLYVPKVEAVVKRREGVAIEDLPIG
jgi:membrane-bound lytic murein transglycosylase D